MREHRLRIGTRDVRLLEGPEGWGECSPFPDYPCDPTAARRSAVEAATRGWPAPVRRRVPVNALVTGGVDADAAGDAAWTRADCVKVKCGRGDVADDLRRVAQVRDRLGPRVQLRVDANGRWDVETAVDVLTRLEPCDLEFAEQPVRSLEELAAVRRRVRVPIAADECVRSVADAERLRVLSAADVVVLKVQPLGGVRAALAVAAASGVPAVVTSMLETSIGLAAGLALACALPELPYACGLDTLGEVDGDVVDPPLVPHDGALAIPRQFPPVPSPALMERYRVDA